MRSKKSGVGVKTRKHGHQKEQEVGLIRSKDGEKKKGEKKGEGGVHSWIG